LLVATDGQRLAAIYDPDGYAQRPAILSLDFKGKALKAKRGEGYRVAYIDLAEKVATMRNAYPDENGDTPAPLDVAAVSEIDGTYPDFWRVLPAETSEEPAILNSWSTAYLADIGAAAKRISGGRNAFISGWHANPGDPCLFTASGCPNARFVVMPARGQDMPAKPDWLAHRDPGMAKAA